MTSLHRPGQEGHVLTLFIYMDGMTSMLTRGRKIMAREEASFESINSGQEEIQSALERFYAASPVIQPGELRSIDLIFVNSIFHRTSSGTLETYKNRLPAFLLYHKSYFDVDIRHRHLAQLMYAGLEKGFEEKPGPMLWFHLRQYILFAGFCTSGGEISISSFKVQKTLDVYYYILFNYQTLQTALPALDRIVISGELVDLDKIHNFFEENVPGPELITYWQWKSIPGKPQIDIQAYLPEIVISV